MGSMIAQLAAAVTIALWQATLLMIALAVSGINDYLGRQRRISLLDLFVINSSFILWLMIVSGRRGESFYFVLYCVVFQAPLVSQAKHC